MRSVEKPKLPEGLGEDNGTLIEVHDANSELSLLIDRANAGEDIVLTRNGEVVALLAPKSIIRSISDCGLIRYEVPRSMGGFGWLGPYGKFDGEIEGEET